VDASPDATLDNIAAGWAREHPRRQVSRQTVGRSLRRQGYTLKKRSFGPPK
jgi:hypothetical protein